jgi:hypothetical protein
MVTLSQAYLEWEHRTRTEGIEQGERSLISRQLTRCLGTLGADLEARIQELSLSQLEKLGEALLDFDAIADLESWLHSQPQD